MKHALLFELDSIQSYLFASGRLRDVAGASELLDQLTAEDGLLDSVCKAASVTDSVEFSRRAGGALYAFSEDEDALKRLRDLWTLAVQQFAPGLGFSFGMGEGEKNADAFSNARQTLMNDGSRLRPRLPVAAPVTERTRRTGQAAEDNDRKDGLIDAASKRRKRFADLAKAGFLKRYQPGDVDLDWHDWPRNLESDGENESGDFPFLGDDRTVALIHADGNGLGQLLIGINEAAKEKPERFIDYFKQFSKLVETITQAAARQATSEVLLPARKDGECLAARPILLGGDDVTVLVRADLALHYCRVFADAFENASRAELKILADKGITGLPERLTLGFGVVFLRASQPFYMAVHLAEGLMSHAKTAAKKINRENPPASLAFYRITNSLVDDYGQIIDRAMTHRRDGETFIDTLGTYYFDANHNPALSDLEELTALLGGDDMARGPTRQLMTLIGHPGVEAAQRYRRWRQLMADRPRLLTRFDSLLEKLAGVEMFDGQALPYAKKSGAKAWRTPLGDALALLSAGHQSEKPTATEEAA